MAKTNFFQCKMLFSLLRNSIFLGIILLFSCCMRFRTSTPNIYKKFNKQSVKVENNVVDGKNMRYLHTGNDTLPLVVFVHGAPGSCDAFFSYMKDYSLLQKCQMMSVDRMGYGYSDFGKSEVSMEKQAFFIAAILEKYKSKDKNIKIILVGHSFGCPIVARLAVDYPQYVSSIILAAGAIDPENEQMFWLNRPASWRIFRWLVPKALRVANDEKMAHIAQLKLLLPKWKDITIPVTYIHGKKDGVVPFINMEFAKKVLINAKTTFITKEKTGHFFPFKKPEIIKNAILGYL